MVQKATELALYKPEDGEFNFAKVFDEDSLAVQNSRYCAGKKLLEKYAANGRNLLHFCISVVGLS